MDSLRMGCVPMSNQITIIVQLRTLILIKMFTRAKAHLVLLQTRHSLNKGSQASQELRKRDLSHW